MSAIGPDGTPTDAGSEAIRPTVGRPPVDPDAAAIEAMLRQQLDALRSKHR